MGGKKKELKLHIATCRKRTDKKYVNQTITWSELLKKLKGTVRTYETVSEYRKMNRKDQANIKDVGGFVAGRLKDGKRNNLSVIDRSIVTLDMDFAPVDFVSDLDMMGTDFECFLYPTHKHTLDKPRYRILIPLTRDVTPDEYEAIARKIADKWGMDYFDDTTYQASRLMFWPSTSSDGVYDWHHYEEDFLDPDRILKEYPDWTDVSFWPRSSRTAEIHKRAAKKQGDPLEKEGLIGAFCRTYTIQEAIGTFIPEVYVPTDKDDRYTFVNGSTAGGLVIYDDKFAYSNHATDPASGQLCNAFDLVRLHRFWELDQDTAPDTAATKLPSYLAMIELCGSDHDTVLTLNRERIESADADFKEELEEQDDSWLGQLETDKKGNVRPTRENILRILNCDRRLKDSIGAFDMFAKRKTRSGKLPWRGQWDPFDTIWTDSDSAGLRLYLEKTYGINSKGATEDAMENYYMQHTFHPVREYLDGLEWDGQKRLDTLFIDYLGCENSEYVRAVTRKSIIAAVTRIYRPGCKYDYMPVLIGSQGIGKSYILSRLGGKWFSDTLTDIRGKEGYEALQGSWIVEMAELTAAKKADIEALKQFISKRKDKYRKAYRRDAEEDARQSVFFGTTNNDEFLRDYTGNRRFWPLDCDEIEIMKDLFTEFTDYERDQVWAEAVQGFRAGEKLYLPRGIEQEAIEQQKSHTFYSEREGIIRDYLDTLLPEDWYEMSKMERVTWLNNDSVNQTGTLQRDKVCVLEIWVEALDGVEKKITNPDRMEINAIMANIGWIKDKNPIQFDRTAYRQKRGYRRPTKV